MFRPLPIFLGLRYSRAKRSHFFVSFIALASMLGIALGVAVLITVLSVMNGFDQEIRAKIFGMTPQVTVSTFSGRLDHWQSLEKKVLRIKHVRADAPYVSGQGMLAGHGEVAPAFVRGIDPRMEKRVSSMGKHVIEGKFSNLKPGQYGIILGDELASRLGAAMGDKITVLTAQPSVTPLGLLPRFKRFRVMGVFHVGGGFGFDGNLALVNLADAQKLFSLGNNITGIRLKVSDLYAAPAVTRTLDKKLPGNYRVSNWTDEYGAFFHAIRMEKTMMFIILILIVGVAAFNLVATLVMVVNDKRSEIAILRTLGASSFTILTTFIVQGLMIGMVGVGLGIVGGVLLANNVTAVVKGLESLLHVHFITSSVYFIDYLPSKLELTDVFKIGGVAMFLSLIATIYPAWQASRTEPAEALRYD